MLSSARMLRPSQICIATCQQKRDQETRNKTTGLKSALMNFQNIVAVVVLQSGLSTVKQLSNKLQKRNSDIYHAYQTIDFVINEVVEMRE